MLARRTGRRTTPAALVAGGVLALATLTGCSSGPLDTTCSEFMEKSTEEQTEIVAEWNKDSVGEELAEISASSNLGSFQSYCSDPANSDDKIKDLEFTFG